MTREQDQALAEIIRSATKQAEAYSAEVRKTIAETQSRAQSLAEIKVDTARFDDINASVKKAQVQMDNAFRELHSKAQADKHVQVQVDCSGIQQAVENAKEANAQVKKTNEMLNKAIQEAKDIKPNVKAFENICKVTVVS